ncbi:MAG: hypothetical protein QM730_07485 [Anaerolineales bacterium]
MTRQSFPVSRTNQVNILAAISIVLVLFSYLWFGSFGLFNHLPTITAYYDKLATAFNHGSLALEEEPDPALLALENPFDRSKWVGINVPTDYSIYKGKFYLYFGPVPAVFLAIGKLVGFGTKGDQYPAFGFICGIFLVQALLLVWIWKRYFSNLPAWLLSLVIFFVGLISPFPWILTRARFFEAASTGGQFFFLLGLYFLLTAQAERYHSKWKPLLAGIFWALAIGSRPTQIVPMGVTVLLFLFLEYRNYLQHKQLARFLSPFWIAFVPFVIGMSILGWYNWARFDSPLETGFSYQLAGPDLQGNHDKLFSTVYVLPNLYNYFINKPVLIEKFPLLSSTEGLGETIYSSLHLPRIYYTGNLTGILYSTPFVLFAGMLLISRKKQLAQAQIENTTSFGWLLLLLLGIFLAEFIPFVSYFWVETRFFADFMPPLAILSVIGFWQGYEFLKAKTAWRTAYIILGIILILFSIIVGISLGLEAHADAFKEFNPDLWKAMYRNFYPGLWKQLYTILSP